MLRWISLLDRDHTISSFHALHLDVELIADGAWLGPVNNARSLLHELDTLADAGLSK